MSKMIAVCTKKAKTLFSEYRTYLSASDHQSQMSIKDVFDMESRFWTSDHTYALRTIDQIPVAEQCRLIEPVDMSDRCLEEVQYCITDILNVNCFFENVLTQLNQKMLLKLHCQSESEHSHIVVQDLDPNDDQLYLYNRW